jgi:hypothetical protein
MAVTTSKRLTLKEIQEATGLKRVEVQRLMIGAPTCKCCKRNPFQIAEYLFNGVMNNPVEYVKDTERFIPGTNHFYCTDCYIKVGMPLY